MSEWLYEEDSLGVFILVTVLLGGGAAALAGRAVALTWRPWWQVVVYSLMLGAAVRFIHFALFDGTLLSIHYYAVDSVICLKARKPERHADDAIHGIIVDRKERAVEQREMNEADRGSQHQHVDDKLPPRAPCQGNRTSGQDSRPAAKHDRNQQKYAQ